MADGVPIVSIGWVADPDIEGRLLPAALLDASGRPDVADLPRVHSMEGVGDLRCSVSLVGLGEAEGPGITFTVEVDHPVSCHFSLTLGWSSHEEWLRAVAASGSMTLGFGDGSGSWLSLNIDPDRLGHVLGGLPDGP